MMNKIKKCERSHYTLKDVCVECGLRTRSAHPMKFSPEDRYGKYRRMAEKQDIYP
ncbi:MAG: RNA-protein complex protein Nop10 [Candidatus Aenigmatarchaeota archaeon]